MKYGQTLHQWSTPEWEAYNVDYNEIKRLIKERTELTSSDAINIPGQKNIDPPTQSFEEDLFTELSSQYDGVQLFIRSKTGEIKRRLDHLQRSAAQLRFKLNATTRKRMPVRLLEKFYKAEGEVIKAGEDIQSLARFISAQRVAFRKLLKKYQKWTHSSQLGLRFEREVLQKPGGLNERDLEPLVLQFTDALSTLRAPFDTGSTWKWDGTVSPKPSLDESNGRVDTSHGRPRSEIFTVSDHGSSVEIDNALATLPLGDRAGHTAYWVHPDNLLQLQILLLQHTRLLVSGSAPPSRRGSVKQLSRRNSKSGSPDDTSNLLGNDEAGVVICGDLESFAASRSGKTIQELESRPGQLLQEATLSIRYSQSGEALAVVPSASKLRTQGSRGENRASMQCKLKRKAISALFDQEQTPIANGSSDPNALQRIRDWIQANRNIRPLVHMQYKRSRFVALDGSASSGTWLVLDKDIQMSKARIDEIDRDIELADAREPFPYAVLLVRWEGQDQPKLVDMLNKTHLAEHVPGFSLEVHAVATLHKDAGVPTPFWLPALSKDIRKLPPKPTTSRRASAEDAAVERDRTQISSASTNSTTDIPSGSGFSQTHTPTSPLTSAPELSEAPPLKLPKRKSRQRKYKHMPPESRESDGATQQRYWNEFDDGDEAPATEAYTILVDPDESGPIFPFLQPIKVWASKTFNSLTSQQRRDHRRKQPERRPLLVHHSVSDLATAEQSDGDSDSPSNPSTPAYHTFPPLRPLSTDYQNLVETIEPPSKYSFSSRDKLLIRYTIAAFLASFASMLLAGLLNLIYHRSGWHRVSADAGTVVGIVLSMFLAIVAVGLSAARQGEVVDWMSRLQVGLAFALLCVGNGVLVILLADG